MRNLLIHAVLGALLLLGVSAFAIDWNRLVAPDGVYRTTDARLEGDPTQLKTRVAGALTAAPVTDYSRVAAGALLFAVDERDYRARAERARAGVAQAQAAVAVAEAQVAQQSSQIGVAQADIQGAEAELMRAQQERVRQAGLLNTESYLARDWQNAVAGAQQAAATVAGTRRALTAAELQLQVLQAQLAGQRASLEAMQAARETAELQLSYTRITAPFDGVVTARLVRRGDYVAAGTALITVVPLQGAWAVANFREEQLTHMHPGQAARVTVDALPGIVFAGHVDSIAPVSQAQSAAMPPDRATGSFTKIVQRVPVKIVLDARPDDAARLRPGLSVEVSVAAGAAAPATAAGPPR